ncbi:hypothetical protein LMG919_09945, partial [Xanthomonas vesicatoria]
MVWLAKSACSISVACASPVDGATERAGHVADAAGIFRSGRAFAVAAIGTQSCDPPLFERDHARMHAYVYKSQRKQDTFVY